MNGYSDLESTESAISTRRGPGPLARFSTPIVQQALVAAVYVVMAIRLIVFINDYAVNILYWDQWDYLNGLFTGESLWESFAQQNGPCRLGVGGLLTRFTFALSHWNVRAETFVSGALLLLSAGVALRIKQRLFGRIEWSDAAIPLLFLTLVQSAPFVVTPMIAHGPAPLMLVMFFCQALLIGNPRLKVAVLLILNFAAIYTGFGLFLGLVSIGLLAVLAFQNFTNRSLLGLYSTGLIVAILSLLSFFVDYKFESAADCYRFPHDRPHEYLTFIAILSGQLFGMFKISGFDLLIGFLGLFLVLLAACRSWLQLLNRTEVSPRTQVIVVLVSFSLLFDVFTAVGRVCLGPGAATVGRYVPYNIPAAFALYLTLIDPGVMRNRLRTVVLALFLVIGVAKEARPFGQETLFYFVKKQAWGECYARIEDIEQCTKITEFHLYPKPEATRLEEKLQYLKRNKLNLFREP